MSRADISRNGSYRQVVGLSTRGQAEMGNSTARRARRCRLGAFGDRVLVASVTLLCKRETVGLTEVRKPFECWR